MIREIKNNKLYFDGCDTTELAKQYGTPLYVFSENDIVGRLRELKECFVDKWPGARVAYACKAFCLPAMLKLVAREGMGSDVVSGGELYTALSVGFPAEKICFHGNNKKYSELVEAVDAGVGRIVVDNLTELETLNTIAGDKGKKVSIMFRIKPGIDAHTHDFVRTGQIDSKFGLALETGEAMQGVKTALSMPNVELKGVHCHIGSQIFDIDPFELAAEVMMKFIKDIKDETGVTITELNLGGGFGIKYLVDDKPEAYENYMDNVAKVVNAKADEYGLPVPFIYIEPGRSIVGATAVTLYTVGSVKKIPDVRNYVSVDGGMVDNPRYILYQSAYEVVCANKINDDKTLTATVAGKCCESGDLIQENVKLPEVEAGDILAVLSTGAYNYSMASNYNRIPRPPVVMVKDGKARLIIKGESYEDIIKNDI